MTYYPPIQIVDEHDEPTGGASMTEAYKQGLIHRIAYVIVEDEAANILLQKRSATMATNPHRWDISVGGHVDEGESYLEAATRELHEELGLSNLELGEPKHFYRASHLEDLHLKRFITVYKVQIPHDTPINFSTEEITEVQWLTLAEIKQLITEHPKQVANGIVECVEKCY